MMLMLWFFQMVYVAADWMVIPLCLSSSIESIVAPTPSFPFTYTPHKRITAQECRTLHTCKTSLHLKATALLIHEHDPGGHLVNLCYPAGVIEDTLGQGGLPRVDVGWDPDVADPLVGEDTGGTCPTAVDEHLGDETEDDRYAHPFLSVYRLWNARGADSRAAYLSLTVQVHSPQIT